MNTSHSAFKKYRITMPSQDFAEGFVPQNVETPLSSHVYNQFGIPTNIKYEEWCFLSSGRNSHGRGSSASKSPHRDREQSPNTETQEPVKPLQVKTNSEAEQGKKPVYSKKSAPGSPKPQQEQLTLEDSGSKQATQKQEKEHTPSQEAENAIAAAFSVKRSSTSKFQPQIEMLEQQHSGKSVGS